MSTRRAAPDVAWTPYLEAFHTERAGITEEILARCHHDGIDPYDGAAQPLAGGPGPVLDLACGSAPMADRLPAWVGVPDPSRSSTPRGTTDDARSF